MEMKSSLLDKWNDYSSYGRWSGEIESGKLLRDRPDPSSFNPYSINTYSTVTDYESGYMIFPKERGIKTSTNQTLVDHYYDPLLCEHHIIILEPNKTYTYMLKDQSYNMIKHEMGFIDHRIIRNKFINKPTKTLAHYGSENISNPECTTKKFDSLREELEDEIKTWCKGILNGLYRRSRC